MHPAFSVIFLTTLIGVGQGLFLALYVAEAGALFELLPAQEGGGFFAAGSALALGFLAVGLFASFFHLGHPERAWRSAAMWRTSWLSREVIVLPGFMAAVFAYGLAHYLGFGGTLMLGGLGVLLCLGLFICTGMIYACLRFLQEWATPLTVVNFILLGCASGFTFAAAFAAVAGGGVTLVFGEWAVVLALAAMCTRVAALVRNRRIKPKSSLQTAIGVKHPRIAQKAQGFMGGSFNTREFFHGRQPSVLRLVKWTFLVLAFPVPVALLLAAMALNSQPFFMLAFAVQYCGLVAERWFFFAQANHPQNLYYQAIS
ncbi:MAG: DmsC/YnfH family molybdoenzyme membrane anchor subunit [Pseudomonadota bacterium]